MTTNFVDALQAKIDELEDEKARIDEKIGLLQELMESEDGEPVVAAPKKKAPATKRKPGRPKGSRNKKSKDSAHAPKDDLYEEAMKQVAGLGGTTKEEQEKRVKSFRPVPRPSRELGAGIKAGTKKEVLEGSAEPNHKANATVSMPDDLEVDEGE